MPASIIDVTQELREEGHLVGEDHNDEDLVFFFNDGYDAGHFVKIKTIYDEPASAVGRLIFRVTGAMAGENGKALRRADDKPEVYDFERTHTAQSFADEDLSLALHQAQRACVIDTVNGWRAVQSIPVIPGVGIRRASPQAPAITMRVIPMEELEAEALAMAAADAPPQLALPAPDPAEEIEELPPVPEMTQEDIDGIAAEKAARAAAQAPEVGNQTEADGPSDEEPGS